jgi:hypothetical protein
MSRENRPFEAGEADDVFADLITRAEKAAVSGDTQSLEQCCADLSDWAESLNPLHSNADVLKAYHRRMKRFESLCQFAGRQVQAWLQEMSRGSQDSSGAYAPGGSRAHSGSSSLLTKRYG